MNEYPLVTQLKEASDYDKVFDLVKSTVEKSISQHRAGPVSYTHLRAHET